jgi:hypothetical protein
MFSLLEMNSLLNFCWLSSWAKPTWKNQQEVVYFLSRLSLNSSQNNHSDWVWRSYQVLMIGSATQLSDPSPAKYKSVYFKCRGFWQWLLLSFMCAHVKRPQIYITFAICNLQLDFSFLNTRRKYFMNVIDIRHVHVLVELTTAQQIWYACWLKVHDSPKHIGRYLDHRVKCKYLHYHDLLRNLLFERISSLMSNPYLIFFRFF